MIPIYIGIDPGKTGGIALICDGYEEVYPAPVSGSDYLEAEMRMRIPTGNVRAAIEKQQSMPKQGVSSTFKTGEGYGLWRGILVGLGVPYEIVTPQTWRKAMNLPAGSDKAASVVLAQRLFPSLSDKLVGPKGGIRDGLAEALLIAEYRRRIG